MSPPPEDSLSSSSSSKHSPSYPQNPNPSFQIHSTHHPGIFTCNTNNNTNTFDFMNLNKVSFNCSEAPPQTTAADGGGGRRRKHIKVKKHINTNINGDSNKSGFDLSSSGLTLGQSGEKECLDVNKLRFSVGSSDGSKVAANVGSEEVEKSGSEKENLNFVFGVGEKTSVVSVDENGVEKVEKVNGVEFVFGDVEKVDMRNVGEYGGEKFWKVNGVDFVFGVGERVHMGNVGENGGKKVGIVNGDFVFGVNEDERESVGRVGTSCKVDDCTAEVDHLIHSISGLNLGTRGQGNVGNLIVDNKTEENSTSFSGISENLNILYSAKCRDIRADSSYQKQESEKKVENFVFGTSGNLGTAATEVKSGDSVNSNVDSGVMFGNSEVNGVFNIGNQNEKRSGVKGRRKPNDHMNNLKSKRAGSVDSVRDGNNSFIFGSNLGNSFSETAQSKVSDETKPSVIHDPPKVGTTNKSNDSDGESFTHLDNVFVFGSDKTSVSDEGVPNGKLKSSETIGNQSQPKHPNETSSSCNDQLKTEAESNGVGINNSFKFSSNVGGFGASIPGFKTPDINLASSFTFDMFPGLGKKLEFSKSNSVAQRKLKKTKAKSKHQGGRTKEVPSSSEEAFGCSPMDVSPYGGTDCASTSTDVNVSARQRPHQKKYKMKIGRGLESTTSKSRVGPSRTHEPSGREHKASDEEICDRWRKRGNLAYKNGDISEAEACYSKGISSIQHTETSGFGIEPLVLCYSNRSAARMALGRMREGLKDSRMAAKLDPSFLKVNIRCANCHLLLGELEDASRYYNKCLESENIVCLDRRIRIEAAEGLQKAQKVADNLKLSAELLQQKTCESATKALGIIADALSISCYSEKLLKMKGEALFMMGKHKEVVQLCEQTLDSAEKNFAAGHMNADGYDSQNSLKLWRWNLMSKSNFHLGRLEIALDLIEKHEQLRPAADKIVDPDDSLALLAVTIRELSHCKKAGNIAYQSGKYTEAVEHYTAAISKSVKSHSFAAVCFCNRAAAHQSLGEIIDAIGDCSLAIALDGSYSKALSRRATLWEMIRDYKHAADDVQRLISILEIQPVDNSQKSATPNKTADVSVKDMRKARRRLSSIEEKAKKERGVKPSVASVEVKKAYRKAALRHHPDKAGQVLARAENGCDGQRWKLIADSIQMDADKLFKMIGEAYAVLSDSTKRSKYDLEEEMWDDTEVTFSSTSRRASDFYSSPYDFSNRRDSHESRKTYNSYSQFYRSSYSGW